VTSATLPFGGSRALPLQDWRNAWKTDPRVHRVHLYRLWSVEPSPAKFGRMLPLLMFSAR
jgi:hypothetical protein